MDGKKRRKPWLRRWDESDESYARFLHYRNLGPCRSLDAAYQAATNSDKPLQATGTWGDDSRKYKWVKRAAAWDIYTLDRAGEKIVLGYVALVESLLTKALAVAAKTEPERWADAVAVAKMLQGFVSSDSINEVRRPRVHRRLDGGRA